LDLQKANKLHYSFIFFYVDVFQFSKM